MKELEEILELEGHVVGQISAVQSVLDLVASVSAAMGITATTGTWIRERRTKPSEFEFHARAQFVTRDSRMNHE